MSTSAHSPLLAPGSASGGTPPGSLADPASVWNRRCLLGLQDLSAEEIRAVLHTARSFADVSNRSVKKVPALRGRVVANLFFEDSTRTRLSFTLAAQRLSADVIDLTETGSSVSKGESIADTCRNVEAMGVDAMVIRHKAAGAALVAARAVKCAVVNAGDGRHEHPTQGLLDVYTLVEARVKWHMAHGHMAYEVQKAEHARLESFDLRGVKVAIVGDIVSSRVARSNIAGLTKLGAEVICVGPPTLVPQSLESLGCRVEHELESVLPHVDAVNMLRIQFERHGGDEKKDGGGPSKGSPAFPSLREYTQSFALTRERAARMKDGAIVMHPGPMNRGIEIAGDVADGPRSVIFRQVTNGLAVRMAALYLCVSAEERAVTAI